jgi:hypothetical protein
MFESVLSNRKQNLISLPAFSLTKATKGYDSKRTLVDGKQPGVGVYERAMKRKEATNAWIKHQNAIKEQKELE